MEKKAFYKADNLLVGNCGPVICTNVQKKREMKTKNQKG
jgi:hypothetical protein